MGTCAGPSRRIGLLAAIAWLLAATVAGADDTTAKEYEVKAAFVYNFAQFTQWPARAFSAAAAPFVVGVIGKGPFGPLLQHAMDGKKMGTHPYVVKHLASADEIDGCQLLFVPAAEDDRLDAIFSRVADHPILTVGESPQFPWKGGTIRFLIEDGKIRFEVNLDSADKAKLHISSKLLNLAKIFKK
jgi:hypothetical protein